MLSGLLTMGPKRPKTTEANEPLRKSSRKCKKIVKTCDLKTEKITDLKIKIVKDSSGQFVTSQNQTKRENNREIDSNNDNQKCDENVENLVTKFQEEHQALKIELQKLKETYGDLTKSFHGLMELVKIENLNKLQNEQDTEFDKSTVPQIKKTGSQMGINAS